MKKAFSLAELLIVLAIISMVISTMKVHVKHRRIQAEAKNIVEVFKIYESALSMYYVRHGAHLLPTFNGALEGYKNVPGKMDVEIPELKPYCPAGFNTRASIRSKKCRDFYMISYDQSPYQDVTCICAEFEPDAEDLLNEVKRQLEETSVPGNVWSWEDLPRARYLVLNVQWGDI